MKDNPKVAIIVPIYNVENYLSHCLDSLLKQTYSNLVFVLINDGSSDKSVEIAKSYCLNNSCFILIDKKINEGLSKTRNTGLEFLEKKFSFQKIRENQYKILENPHFEVFSLTPPPQLIDETIEYIEFLDSDDYLESDCIEVSIRYAQQYQLDLVCAGINHITNEYKKISSDFGLLHEVKKNKILKGIEIIRENKYNFFYGSWNILINFKFLKSINLRFINGIIYEDHYFGIMLFMKARRIIVLNYFFYYYVNTMNSITRPKEITQSRVLLNFQSWKMTIEKLEQDVQDINYKKIYQKFLFPDDV